MRVRLNGAPADGLDVTVVPVEDARRFAPGVVTRPVRTDGEGRASARLPAAAPMRISVRSARGILLGTRDVAAADESPLEIDLDAGRLAVVLPPGTRVPAAGTVHLDAGECGFVSFDGAELAGEEVRLDLGWVPAGVRELRVSGDVLAYGRAVEVAAAESVVCRLTLDDAE